MTSNDQRWQQINDLLERALEQPVAERDAWIAEACRDDPALQAELRELLTYDNQQTGDLRASIASASARATDALIGTTVGAYRITARIAEGGMGVVYAGLREGADFEQRVAIKVMHSHQLDEMAMARFVAERRILAALSHANIASLIDGGMTSNGLPYIVMEYVEGENIADYCANQQLDVASTIRLVIKVCGALQYAHNQLIIHRDIKPSNILIDANGAPRLLDFGIAKLLERDDADLERTRPELRAATPMYASPEQFGDQSISTAADVYGIGLLLYRLLTGRLPYTPTSEHPRDVENAILSAPAEPPSDAVTQLAGSLPPQWIQRRRRALRGDLDTILLKALRKEPARRYATVEAFAEDLRRYLQQLPIQARRDTLAYRMRKFISRQRVPVALTSLMVISAIGLTTFYTARLATEREVAQQTADFLTDLFVDTHPHRRSRDNLTVSDLVIVGADKVVTNETLKPEVRARLQRTIAVVLNFVSETERAEQLVTEALSVYERGVGSAENHIDALRTLSESKLQRGNYDDALAVLDRARGLAESTFGKQSLQLGAIACDAAYLHYRNASYEAIRENATASLAIYEASLPANDERRLCPLHLLATYYSSTGETRKSLEQRYKILELRTSQFGEDNIRLAEYLQNIGVVLTDLGNYREAIRYHQRATDLWRPASGDSIQKLPLALYGLAHTTGKLGRFAEAHQLFEELVALQTERSGDTHDTLAYWLNGHGDMLTDIGETALAEQAFQRATAIYEEIEKPAGHFDRSVTLVGLGKVARDRGDLETAERLMREGIKIREDTIRKEHSFTQLAHIDLADVLYRQGRLEDARVAFDQALIVLRDTGNGEHPTVALALTGLARIALAEKHHAAAIDLLTRSITMTEASIGEDHLFNVERRLLLAEAIAQGGDTERAESLRRSADEQRSRILAGWSSALTENISG